MEQNIQELWESYRRYNIYVLETPKEKKKRKEERQHLSNNDCKFPQINVRHHISWKLRDTKQDKH